MDQSGTQSGNIAFILHRRPFSNNSLLIEFFSREAGRFPAVARGVANRKVRGGNILQPFLPLQISCRGRGEVVSLIKYEMASRPMNLFGERLLCAFYITELIMRLLHRHDAHSTLFDDYMDTLRLLAGDGAVEPLLRRFELRLLNVLGYGITLDFDAVNGERVDPDGRYQLIVEQGVIRTESNSENAFSGATLLALASDAVPRHCWKEARRLTRRLLNHYLGDKPLKSRELFIKEYAE